MKNNKYILRSITFTAYKTLLFRKTETYLEIKIPILTCYR